MTTNIYARRNSYGVSINETTVCERCLNDEETIEASLDAWNDAEDVDRFSFSYLLHPVDNYDAICIGCGAKRVFNGTLP